MTLNRPDVRNALSHRMLRELLGVLAELEGSAETGAIVLTGAGPGFCSGDDLSEAASTDAETFDESVGLLQRLTGKLLDMETPVIAAINGPAMGGGLELTLACDLRLASQHAVFACPEVAWGLVVTNGASVLLPAIVGHGRARDMVLTGRTFDPAWALTAGLVSEVLPGDRLVDRAVALAEEMASRSQAVRLTRRLLDHGGREAVAGALAREAAAVGEARRGPAGEKGLRDFAARHSGEGGGR
ncbi:enoyl-CoA hydratase/isomerase family protein [Actinomadura sp. WMMA1423]|uniref:enoyl-CoA hydratase/isomerase family protein n=1 Tax=Actinomadura sp. WMMA1423 TaxID=2591108 RepID=UPI00143DEAE9|nr:enoyl-CoA hydratase/isomerase family protein [Actinomadura sp. WMMA1423]